MINKAKPSTLLEVGVGSGWLKAVCQQLGVSHQSIDLAADLHPDILADVKQIPLPDQSVDLTCAFQVLEHIPYQDALQGFRELCRVSRRDILISLPNARATLTLQITLPVARPLRVLVPCPLPPLQRMIRSHRWEIGRQGISLRRFIRDFGAEAQLLKQFRVFEYPYHHVFHFVRA